MTEILPNLDFLDPNHVTRLAYVFHTAGDVQRSNKTIGDIAQKEIDTFSQIKSTYPLLSREGIYLSSISIALISLANDITRRKRTYLQELEAADLEYDAAYTRIVKSNISSIILKALYKAVQLAFLAALGVFIAQTLAPFIPDAMAHRTGRRAPSFAMMTLFSLGGYLVSYKLSEVTRQSIEAMRTWRKQEAILKYDRGRLEAFRQHWQVLIHAWQDYTHKTYEQVPYFEAVIVDELSTDSEYIMQLRARQRSALLNAYARSCRACGWAVNYVKTKRKGSMHALRINRG